MDIQGVIRGVAVTDLTNELELHQQKKNDSDKPKPRNASQDALSYVKVNNILSAPSWRNARDILENNKLTKRQSSAIRNGMQAVRNAGFNGEYGDEEFDEYFFLTDFWCEGYYEIADMANQGKSKKEILKALKDAHDYVEQYRVYERPPEELDALKTNIGEDSLSSIMELAELYEFVNDYGNGYIPRYIDECIKLSKK